MISSRSRVASLCIMHPPCLCCAHSDLCRRLRNRVVSLEESKSEKWNLDETGINKNIQITLEGQLESRTNDSRDEFSNEGRLIPKWIQYHCMNSICILQYKYSLS